MTDNEKILRLVSTFEEVFDDVVAPHELMVDGGTNESESLSDLLKRARTVCLPIEAEIEASLCLSCDHFIGCHKDGEGTLIIECWTHRKRLARGTKNMKAPILS